MLTDRQIKEAIARIGLLQGEVNPTSAKYASFELHASDIVEKLVYDGDRTGHVEYEVAKEEIRLPPFVPLKIYTRESLNLPDNVHANVVALGQLFGVGITAGSTYVDPGSRGPIYITVTNISSRTIIIPVGQPIARAQFFELPESVETKHPGFLARRELRLRTEPPPRAPQTLLSRDPAAGNARIDRLESMLARQRLLSYTLLLLVVGIFYSQQRPAGNVALQFLLGDGLPQLLRLVVPLIVGGVASLLFEDVRQTIRRAFRRMSRSPTLPQGSAPHRFQPPADQR